MISMNELGAMAHALVSADREIEAAEEALRKAKEHARILREETLPCAMNEIGLSDVKLSTGEKITVKQDVYIAIPADSKDACFDWLEKNGFGGLIKTEVKVAFGRGESDKAEAVMEALEKRGASPTLKRDVHAQTLKAWAREQLSDGKNFPMDQFGARPVWVAQVK